MQLQAKTIAWETVRVGDEIPPLRKSESQESIDGYGSLSRGAEAQAQRGRSLHTDVEYAQQGIFAGTVNMGVATCAYMMEALEGAFPPKSLLNTTYTMRALEPFRAGDTVTFTGKVVGKREEGGKRLVEVEMSGTNQLGQMIAVNKYTVPL